MRPGDVLARGAVTVMPNVTVQGLLADPASTAPVVVDQAAIDNAGLAVAAALALNHTAIDEIAIGQGIALPHPRYPAVLLTVGSASDACRL